jgi:DNA/RNA endonuclease G (NUC1)
MTAEAFVYGEYRTFQVPVTEIEQKTRLDFGDLRDHDPKRALAEAAPARRVELTDFSDIVL